MRINSQTINKRINHQERHNQAMYLREVHSSLLKHGRSELEKEEVMLPKEEDHIFESMKSTGYWLLLAGIICVAGCFLPSKAHAARINDSDAVLAIIGESEAEGHRGMLAVACGIRNRGTLSGVFGLNSSRIKKHLYSEKIQIDAINAWIISETPTNCTFIKGATHWDSIDFKKPLWANSMESTFSYNKHVFYKEI